MIANLSSNQDNPVGKAGLWLVNVGVFYWIQLQSLLLRVQNIFVAQYLHKHMHLHTNRETSSSTCQVTYAESRKKQPYMCVYDLSVCTSAYTLLLVYLKLANNLPVSTPTIGTSLNQNTGGITEAEGCFCFVMAQLHLDHVHCRQKQSLFFSRTAGPSLPALLDGARQKAGDLYGCLRVTVNRLRVSRLSWLLQTATQRLHQGSAAHCSSLAVNHTRLLPGK